MCFNPVCILQIHRSCRKSVFMIRKHSSICHLPSLTFKISFTSSSKRSVQTAYNPSYRASSEILLSSRKLCTLAASPSLVTEMEPINLPGSFGFLRCFLYFRKQAFFCTFHLFFTYCLLVACVFGGICNNQSLVQLLGCVGHILVVKTGIIFG